MEILIKTNGYSKTTEILINGELLSNLNEFHFSLNPTRKKSDHIVEGKCKMQIITNKDFRSYFGEDFIKWDEYFRKREE